MESSPQPAEGSAGNEAGTDSPRPGSTAGMGQRRDLGKAGKEGRALRGSPGAHPSSVWPACEGSRNPRRTGQGMKGGHPPFPGHSRSCRALRAEGAVAPWHGAAEPPLEREPAPAAAAKGTFGARFMAEHAPIGAAGARPAKGSAEKGMQFTALENWNGFPAGSARQGLAGSLAKAAKNGMGMDLNQPWQLWDEPKKILGRVLCELCLRERLPAFPATICCGNLFPVIDFSWFKVNYFMMAIQNSSTNPAEPGKGRIQGYSHPMNLLMSKG